MDRIDPRLAEAIQLFNDREFFACHDVLEDLWGGTLGEKRQCYQGWIHAAVALFHFGEGNLGGARKMYGSACRYLTPFRPVCESVDLERFLTDFQRCFKELASPHDRYPSDIKLDEALIPSIEETS